MKRKRSWWWIGLGALAATAACDDGVAAGESPSTETGMVELDVALIWNAGEGDENEPLPEGVRFDDYEGQYLGDFRVVLGPVTECVKPYGERSPDAHCSWDVPSSWWSADLGIRQVEGVATVELDIFGGDADTSGGAALPVESLPTAGPWTFDFSPDNASGAWGSFEASITRVAAGSPAASCCVMCSVGRACGNSCIAAEETCSQSSGCACDAP